MGILSQMIERIREQKDAESLSKPPGWFDPTEPIYIIPPIEWTPELTISAEMMADQRDWGHQALGLEAIHKAGHTGRNVLIAICDTGIDVEHKDLRPNCLKTGHKDFTGSPAGYLDKQSHGTHCAGISAAAMNEDGIIGAAPEAKLLASKVLSDQGSGASSWIAAGIIYSTDMGADIISLSLGGPSPDSRTREAIQYAISKGCWVVCAAGNDGREAVSYPGHYPESIAVCATDDKNRRASFSTINQQNDISAPGVSILSTLPNGRYGTMSGTSMATPYVAGSLALVRGALKEARRPIPGQAEILTLFGRFSQDIPPTGRDSGTGFGLINPAALIKELVGTTPIPPVPPIPPPDGEWVITIKGRGPRPVIMPGWEHVEISDNLPTSQPER